MPDAVMDSVGDLSVMLYESERLALVGPDRIGVSRKAGLGVQRRTLSERHVAANLLRGGRRRRPGRSIAFLLMVALSAVAAVTVFAMMSAATWVVDAIWGPTVTSFLHGIGIG